MQKKRLRFGILTIYGMDNFGNRLQNYALQEFIKENFGYVETIENIEGVYNDDKLGLCKFKIKNWIRAHIPKNIIWKKYSYFYYFNKLINTSSIHIDSNHVPVDLYKKYDYFLTGSDQVWNPNFNRISDIDFLTFCKNKQKIAFSASFGVSKLEDNQKEYFYKNINSIPNISVREDSGKCIIKELGIKNNVEVLADPTMLISPEKWRSISKKPKNFPNKKYIFKYFLGNMSAEKTNQMVLLAKENDLDIIDILDINDACYCSGPAEFLYLEEHAELVLTDSFHSCVFAILFERPFVVYERDDNNKDMSSRLDTLLNKFELSKNKYSYILNNKNLAKIEYDKQILEKEKEKAIKFLKDSIVENN